MIVTGTNSVQHLTMHVIRELLAILIMMVTGNKLVPEVTLTLDQNLELLSYLDNNGHWY